MDNAGTKKIQAVAEKLATDIGGSLCDKPYEHMRSVFTERYKINIRIDWKDKITVMLFPLVARNDLMSSMAGWPSAKMSTNRSVESIVRDIIRRVVHSDATEIMLDKYQNLMNASDERAQAKQDNIDRLMKIKGVNGPDEYSDLLTCKTDDGNSIRFDINDTYIYIRNLNLSIDEAEKVMAILTEKQQ